MSAVTDVADEFAAARELLGRILQEAPFPVKARDDADFDYLTAREGVPVMFAIRADDNDKPLLLIQAIVLADVPFGPGLYEWVATEGQWNLRFGAAVQTTGDGHGVLTFVQSIDLFTASAQTVVDYVEVILDRAVHKADRLAARFGGETMRSRSSRTKDRG